MTVFIFAVPYRQYGDWPSWSTWTPHHGIFVVRECTDDEKDGVIDKLRSLVLEDGYELTWAPAEVTVKQHPWLVKQWHEYLYAKMEAKVL